MRYRWPGNVRELRNVVERAVIFAAGPAIGPQDLPGEVRAGDGELPAGRDGSPARKRPLPSTRASTRR